ncbi:PepSY domain-containing protein [Kordiimonas sp. SCSIO 12603]|uniref:PepSY-associated TM helix domain-containing protein n=1 Tax=Kordiimonas sp. SCSIO 12603 TaxID=2829596 RepID=UPI002102CBA8|nr:PepSY-associated TM helix domain-containing protein [Kordiimonas sp. SCSIO 12603]UTW59933.1 PepSY domain-containing protein [Kordiimonas sp. SCSIO 12603]
MARASTKRGFTFKDFLVKLHLYLGLTLGLLFALLGLTGSMLAFDDEIVRLMNSDKLTSVEQGHMLSLEEATLHMQNWAETHDTKGELADIQPPTGSDGVYSFNYREGRRNVGAYKMDAYSGEILGEFHFTDTFMFTVMQFHEKFLAGGTGKTITGITAGTAFFILLSGYILWWPKKRRFKQAFKIKWNANTMRVLFDSHKAFGAALGLVMIVSAFTGFTMAFPEVFEAPISAFSERTQFQGPFESKDSGGEPLSLSALVMLVDERYSGGTITDIRLPRERTATYRLEVKHTGDIHEDGDTILLLDQYTGAELINWSPSQMTAADSFFNWMRPLHEAQAFGLIHQILFAIAGLLPPFLYVTGVWMWLKKRKLNRKPKRTAAAAA